MNKLHLTTLIMALTLSCSVTQARSLTPDEALSMVSRQSQKIKGSDQLPMQLSYTQKMPMGEENALYVFANTDTKGFAVVAADDAVGQLLLGYSDTEAFDSNNVPPSMQAWMEAWARTIQASAESGVAVSTVKSGRQDVTPIVKTKWNQGSPYNDKCPIVDGKRSVTGCVATSVAQVMNVHQWPQTGQGTVSYDWKVNGKTYNASLDFSTVTFDWDSMLDTYSKNSNEKSCEAVATLMYACGVGAHMDYSPELSSANDYDVATSLIENFGYDIGINVQKREWYTVEEWDNMIYDQLIKGLPISYGGINASGGGHQFVIDGYISDGYYHINWGWGGLSDGYFKLYDLDPSSLGIGGGSGESGYNFKQTAIIGFQKPVSNSNLYTVMGSKYMSTDASSYSRNSYTQIKFEGGFFSYTLLPYNFKIGVHIRGLEIDDFIPSSDDYIDLNTLQGYERFRISTFKFPVGEYDVYPAFQPEDGEWQNMKYPVESWSPLHFSVDNDIITVVDPNAQGSVYAEIVGFESVNGKDDNIYTGHYYNFIYDIESDGKWEGDTQVLLIKDNYFYSVSESKDVEFNFAGKQTLSYTMQIDADIDGGEYELVLTYKTDYGYMSISDRTLIDVKESPVTGSGYVADVEFVYSPSPGISEEDPAIMVRDAATVEIILQASDAPWQDDVWIYFADANSLSIISQTESQPICIDKKGDITTLTFTGPWDDLETDRIYAMAPWAKGAKQLSYPYYFKLVENGSASAQLVFVGSSGDGLKQVATLDSQNQIVEAKIQCVQAPYKDNLRLAFADMEGTIIGWSDYKYVELPEPNSSDVLKFEGPWDFLDLNTYYLTTLFNNKYEYISNVYTFMVEEKVFPTEITLSEQSITMEIDDVQVLQASVYPENATYEHVEWSSSDTDVASVILNGRIRAWKEGTATITASVQGAEGSITASCEVIVVKHNQTISWDQEFDEVEEGSVITLTATASSGLEIKYEVVKGAGIVTLEGNVLTIHGEGEVEVIAMQSGNDEYAAADSVSKIFWAKAQMKNWPTEITLNEQSLTMEIDDVVVLQASVYPEDAIYEHVEWTSSDTDVASVILNGRVRAWKEGTAIITASVQGVEGSITATCEVTVIKHNQTISWDQEFDEVKENSVITLTATASSGLGIEYKVEKGTDIVILESNVLTIIGEGEIEIMATQPGNEEYAAAEPVSKTFWSKAGILSAINDGPTIKVEGNVVIISGLKKGEIVRIYTPDGIQVYTGSENRITLQHNQVYLLIFGDNIVKLHTR